MKNKSFKCQVDGCDNKARAKLYCEKHYAKIRQTGTLERIAGTEEGRNRLIESHKKFLSPISQIDNFQDSRKGQRGYYGNKIIKRVRRDAIKAGYEWHLTDLEAYYLCTSSCTYCGSVSNWPEKRNGIDRVDSTKEYITDNCVTACFSCNAAKGAKSYDEFMNWIKILANYNGFTKEEIK
jgi:5-methylcytosine-specific restriction endonuclease McrA